MYSFVFIFGFEFLATNSFIHSSPVDYRQPRLIRAFHPILSPEPREILLKVPRICSWLLGLGSILS